MGTPHRKTAMGTALDGPTVIHAVGASAVSRAPSSGPNQTVAVLIGALIALLGAVFVQWVVVPRVNRKTRAQERWEQDILTMGTLLSEDVALASEALRSAWLSWSTFRGLLVERGYGLDRNDRIKEQEANDRTAYRAAEREWGRLVNVRLEWLGKRVLSLPFDGSQLFEIDLRMLQIDNPSIYDYGEWKQEQLDHVKTVFGDEARTRKRLLEAIDRAAAAGLLSVSRRLLRRARHRSARVVARLRRSGTQGST
jgi:hypothetical protein